MCKAMEEMREKAVREFSIKQIKQLISKGWAIEQISEAFGCDKALVLSVQKELLHAVK